jgi:hypothetical protein
MQGRVENYLTDEVAVNSDFSSMLLHLRTLVRKCVHSSMQMMSVRNNAYLKDYLDSRLELLEVKVRTCYWHLCFVTVVLR